MRWRGFHGMCKKCGRRYRQNGDGSIRKHACSRAHQPTVVSLRTGGTLTVGGDVNLCYLGSDERRLLSTIADAIAAYRASAPAQTVPAVESAVESGYG